MRLESTWVMMGNKRVRKGNKMETVGSSWGKLGNKMEMMVNTKGR